MNDTGRQDMVRKSGMYLPVIPYWSVWSGMYSQFDYGIIILRNSNPAEKRLGIR